jgi:hypothetical protein
MASSRPRDFRWRTSSASGGSDCVEVAFLGHDDEVLVRRSGDPDGPVLRFTRAEWNAFVTGVQAGEFDG